MSDLIDPIGKLVNTFSKLPQVGARTALKYAYKIISMTDEQALDFANGIIEAKSKIKYCSECGNFTAEDPCPICQNRDKALICVVKQPKDVLAIERTHDFKGVYHVLHGTISPMDGIGPDQLNLNSLLSRVDENTEVIVATNPDVEGEATAMYIARILKPLGVKVTRIARGIPLGSELEYTDEITLIRALQDRKEM